MADNKMSNTMEIDSILQEARARNRNQAAAAGRSANTNAPRTRVSTPRAEAAPSGRRAVDDGYVDISDSAAYNRSRAAQQPQTAQKKKSKAPLVITLVVVVVLVLAGVGGFMWFKYQNSGSTEVVADNVTVNGKDLSGMTMDEAKKAMAGIEESLADGIKVDIKAADKNYTLTKDDFSYSFNTDEILDQVKKHSEEKSLSKDKLDLEITMKVDTSNAQAIADKIAKDVHTDPVDARVSEFDPSADDMFTYQKEVTGQDLDSKDLVNKIDGVFRSGKTSGSVEGSVKTVEPKITAAYLEDNIVKLSSYSTISTNNSNGNENMRVSLNACDGSIIEPGETWSFNDCTGDSNDPDNGYLPAGVIVQGRSETGYGGGICQSSTTIYNACLLCGMTTIERACHYYKSTYVDAGRDATIDYGNIDLKMENPFDYQLFMKCWMDGTELNCEMYGLENPNFDEIEISTSDPEYFSNGYTVEAWRTYYKNGKEVDEDDLFSSTYYTSAPSSGSSSDSGSSGGYDNSDDDDGGDDDSDAGNADAGNSDAGNADAGGDAGGAEGPAAPDA